ncbi:sensor histidine kinase [Nocardiopsis sp. NPDC055824]
MSAARPRPTKPLVSARFRLALSYAAFLVAAGAVLLAGVYVVLRYVPNYPLTAANPSEAHLPIASRSKILTVLVHLSGALLAALALIGITGGWFLAGWVLRPLQRIDEAVRLAAEGRLDHRIRLTGINDEFRRLADAFDHMLDRLDDAFATQERFAANASHELRTPLAVTGTLLDVARQNPDGQDYPALVERLSITNARAVGLTEALLRLADANAVTAAAAPLDLAGTVRAAVREAGDEARRCGVTWDLRLEAAPVLGDGALLAQLAANLVQNAVRHNTAPGTALAAAGHDPRRGLATLRIENTGPGYTTGTAARLREPFLRGEGRTRRRDGRGPGAGGGYGLGLALVARVVDVHGGTLDTAPREGGGLVVTVTLPAHPV